MGNQGIKAVAFDLEGTIINLEPAHHFGHIAAAAEFGVSLSIDDCFRKLPHFIGGPDEEIAKEIAALSNGADWQEILRRDHQHYEQLLKGLDIKPRPGFLDALSEFKSLGLKIAVGSCTPEKEAKIFLEKSNLLSVFDEKNIVLREHVKNIKPDPDIWIEVARRICLRTDELLVFDDSPRGILGAFHIGATCIGMPVYNRIETTLALMQAGAKRVFIDWREINVKALFQNINT